MAYDLIDFSDGGNGWHITSHIIAVIALFVACFAITGYITFRDHSVPGKALKDDSPDFDNITADTLNLTETLDVGGVSSLTGGVNLGGNHITNHKLKTISIPAPTAPTTRNITAAESGAIFLVTGAATDITLAFKLPRPQIGLHYEFYLTNNAVTAGDVTITSTTNGSTASNLIRGFNVVAAAILNVAGSGATEADVITFAKTFAIGGDHVELMCISSNTTAGRPSWVAKAYENLSNAITFNLV